MGIITPLFAEPSKVNRDEGHGIENAKTNLK